MNEIIPFKGQKVAKAFAHLDAGKSLGAGIVAGGFPVINYRGKAWSLRYQGQSYPFVREDDGTPLSYLDVIIVGTADNVSKVYYPPGEWDEDAAGAPVCASVKGDAPDPGVPEPQSKSCATCKNNAWTTLPTGRRGKACQDHKRVAVILMPAVTAKMLGAPLTEPVYLKVPPGSLTALKAYGNSLSHQGFPAAAVITRISFSADKLFQMKFEGKQVLTDAEAPLVLPLLDDPRTRRITGETPEIYEVEAAPIKKEDAPISTGLLEAFGTPPQGNGGAADVPVKRGRGRPPKPVPEPQPKLDLSQPGVLPDKVAAPWAEGDPELDSEVADLLGRKVADMLK